MEDVRGTPGRRHCVIDCIPVPKEVEQDAPLYFKKELQDVLTPRPLSQSLGG